MVILTGGHLDHRRAKRFGLQGSADRAAGDLLANASQRKAQMGKLQIDIDRAVAVLDLRLLQVGDTTMMLMMMRGRVMMLIVVAAGCSSGSQTGASRAEAGRSCYEMAALRI